VSHETGLASGAVGVGGLDRFVFRRLEKAGICPSYCTDAVFLRRASA